MKNYVLYKGISGQDFVSCKNEDGTFTSFLTDPANSDYQAYLNKDKPVEHLTESLSNDSTGNK